MLLNVSRGLFFLLTLTRGLLFVGLEEASGLDGLAGQCSQGSETLGATRSTAEQSKIFFVDLLFLVLALIIKAAVDLLASAREC